MADIKHLCCIAANLILLLTLLVAPTSTAAAEGLLVTVDGPQTIARFMGVQQDGALLFRGDAKIEPIPALQLVRWGRVAETDRGPLVFAADGSLWATEQTFASLEIADEKIHFGTEFLGEVTLGLDQTRGIVFHPPKQFQRRDALIDRLHLAAAEDAPAAADVVLLENGDQLSGTILGLSDEKLRVQSGTDTLELDIRKIVAVIFNPALVKSPRAQGLRLAVGFGDGSRLMAAAWSPNTRFTEFTTVGGKVFSTESDQVTALQALGGAAKYLSDLQPSSYRHKPYLSVAWPYRPDRNVLAQRLRAGGRLYEKGIGVHSVAGLTYRLDEPYKRFEAELAIDDATSGRGSVVFRVHTDDGSGRWQVKYESPVVRGGDAPLPISVAIVGAKRISLIVDIADRGDVLDHADWLDARLLP